MQSRSPEQPTLYTRHCFFPSLIRFRATIIPIGADDTARRAWTDSQIVVVFVSCPRSCLKGVLAPAAPASLAFSDTRLASPRHGARSAAHLAALLQPALTRRCFVPSGSDTAPLAARAHPSRGDATQPSVTQCPRRRREKGEADVVQFRVARIQRGVLRRREGDARPGALPFPPRLDRQRRPQEGRS